MPEARATYEGRRSALGDDHPDTLASGHELAVALDCAGHRAEAHEVVSAVHEGTRPHPGPRGPRHGHHTARRDGLPAPGT
nr:hypothetical protein [Streptomyces atriruber]